MNYERVVQLANGRWGVARNNGPHSCVIEWDRPWTPEDDGIVSSSKFVGTSDFATAEEAAECWRKYDMGKWHSGKTNGAAEKCLESGEWTDHYVAVGMLKHFPLKPEFHNPAILEKHYPRYNAGMQMSTSY